MNVYHDSGINWVWYLQGHWEGDAFFIERYYRLHNSRDVRHPATEGNFRLVEDNERTVTGVYLNDKWFRVANPQYIFSYWN